MKRIKVIIIVCTCFFMMSIGMTSTFASTASNRSLMDTKYNIEENIDYVSQYTNNDYCYPTKIIGTDNHFNINSFYIYDYYIDPEDLSSVNGFLFSNMNVLAYAEESVHSLKVYNLDPIVNIVPIELFRHCGEYFFIGQEYGFYVRTRSYSSDEKDVDKDLQCCMNSSVVMVFNITTVIDFEHFTNNYLEYEVLFMLEYIYVSEEGVNLWDSGEKINDIYVFVGKESYSSDFTDMVFCKSFDSLKYDELSDETLFPYYEYAKGSEISFNNFSFFLETKNINYLNQGHSKYDPNDDNCIRIVSSNISLDYYSTETIDKDDMFSSKSFQLIDSVIGELILDSVPILNTSYSLYSLYNEYESTKSIVNDNSDTQSMIFSQYIIGNNPFLINYGASKQQQYMYFGSEQLSKAEIRNVELDDLIKGKNIKSKSKIKYSFSFTSDGDIKGVSDKVNFYLNSSATIYDGYLGRTITPINEYDFSFELKMNDSYNLSISNKLDIYTIDNNYCSFSFVPENDNYYFVSLNKNYFIQVYNRQTDGLVISGYKNVGFISNANSCDEYIILVSNPDNLNVDDDYYNFSITIDYYLINFGQSIDVSNYLCTTDSNKFRLSIPTSGYYFIEFNTNLDDITSDLVFITNSNNNTIKKCDDFVHDASNSAGENTLIVYLEANEIYYLLVDYIDATYFSIYINRIGIYDYNDYKQTTEEMNFSVTPGDEYITIRILYNGLYNINFDCVMENKGGIIVKKINVDENTVINSTLNITSYNKTLENVELYAGDYLNIIFLNVDSVNNFCIERYISSEGNIQIELDPDWVSDEDCGTEVSLNGGSRYSNSITIGLTRNAFISSTVSSNSRLAYYWFSSNEEVASVSDWGTIFAYSPGTTTIQAVYQNDMSIVVFISIVVYDDYIGDTHEVVLTTDMREVDEHNGTEVLYNGGVPGEFTIHVGYTRSICFKSGNPSYYISDYEWTTSNSSVAYVSDFGTIYAVSAGTVTITGVYKYNSNYIATIVITVI